MKSRLNKLPPHYAPILRFSAKEESDDILLPHSQDVVFNEMREIFRNLKIKKTLFVGPPFWQTEIIYHQTCRQLKIPDCVGSIYNLPLAAKLIKQLNIEAVITTGRIFTILKNHLVNKKINSVSVWYFFGEPLRAEIFQILKDLWPKTKIFLQYAPFPPIPLSYQCLYLSGQPNLFHLSQRKSVKVEISPENEILMTIERPLVFQPIRHHRTGNYGEIYEKSCPCGEKRIFKIRV